MSILVTGAGGFIGFHLCKRLIGERQEVIGIDNINNYYDVKLKNKRIEILKNSSKNFFHFFNEDIENKENIFRIFDKYNPTKVVNLAAQAGVRYSIENPDAYIQANLVGFLNIIECCRKFKVDHFVYASSSSVYGGNEKMPFSEVHNVDHPVSLYAATKKSNELIAHSYSHLYSIPSTGLRFFTVYGPWGRPDMALFLFTKAIIEDNPIEVFNQGNMIRDFTYIDDIIESLFRVLNKPPKNDPLFNKANPNPSISWAPHRIFNIGNSEPTPLMKFIEAIESSLGKKAKKIFLPMQPGDVKATSADTKLLEQLIDFKPHTSVEVGIKNFVDWYRDFYEVS
jgi:UDP-glucuronate 4-epimerase